MAFDLGLGARSNTILQTCFFAISGVLPRDEAIAAIKKATERTYGRKGAEVVEKNFAAVDDALAHLHEVKVPANARRASATSSMVPDAAPAFVRNVTAVMLDGRGDEIPVSAMPIDGTYPTGTTRYEKRNIADEVPIWEPDLCIQCGQCAIVCPHSVIRAKYYDRSAPRRTRRRLQGGADQRARLSRIRASRCRSTSRTAPAAACASRPARRTARRTTRSRRST